MNRGSNHADLSRLRNQAAADGWEVVWVFKEVSAGRYYREPSGQIRLLTNGAGSRIAASPGPVIKARLEALGFRFEREVTHADHEAGLVPWGATEVWVKA